MCLYLKNNEIKEGIPSIPDETGKLVIYEVLRAVNSKPLFLQEHLSRLIKSCQIVHTIKQPSVNTIRDGVYKLIDIIGLDFGNIMIKLVFDQSDFDIYVMPVSHKYPGQKEYLDGVDVEVLHAKRNNPEPKVQQQNVRMEANQLIADKRVFEVVLTDQDNCITEGSRSNICLIKNNEICTTPLNLVLSGITLQKVLLIADEMKIKVNYERIHVESLPDFDAAFITGTSPKILPVKRIGAQSFSVENEMMRSIMKKYDQMISEDIKKEAI
jgi:branched-chain amino acid aminotransferase